MPDVLLCSRPLSPGDLFRECAIPTDQVCRPGPSFAPFHAYTPYLVGPSTPLNQSIVSALHSASADERKNLVQLTQGHGADDIVALAGITSPLITEGLDGASDVYGQRMAGFRTAVKKYQEALLKYRDTMQSKAETAMRNSAKQAAQLAYQDMQGRFRAELAAVHQSQRTARRSPLTNPERGLNIARSSRNAVKLHVADQAQAHSLVRFSRYAKALGNGITVIDFASRIGNVRNEYKAGGDWNRELFIESSSFAASTGAGTVVASAGTVALGFLVAATPVGWVGIVVVAGGLAVAGATAGTSIAVNSTLQKNGGGLYDSIMRRLQ